MILNKNKVLLDIAMDELGILEIKGSEHNPRILEYHSVTKLHATTDEVPWCSSFVNWVVVQSGQEPTRSAMAASWRYWGKRMSKPRKGCIIGYVKQDGSGHVGLFLGEKDGLYKILGGNQADSVKVSSYRIKGRRWFFTEPKVFMNSKIARSGGTAAGIMGVTGGSTVLDSLNNLNKDSKEIKASISEISSNLGSVGDTSIVQQATPWLVIGLCVFIVYDRLNKERVRVE